LLGIYWNKNKGISLAEMRNHVFWIPTYRKNARDEGSRSIREVDTYASDYMTSHPKIQCDEDCCLWYKTLYRFRQKNLMIF